MVDWVKLVRLRRRVFSLPPSRWDVTNLGIQVSLPVIHRRHLPRVLRAVLPCCNRDGNLLTIDLHSPGHSIYERQLDLTWITLDSVPELRSQLRFTYIQNAVKSCYNLRLHDRRAAWHGFTRCGAFPRNITDNTATLSSQESTLIILVYANDVGSRFAVGFGYYFDKVWSCIVCDERPAEQEALSWVDFAKQVYDGLWSSSINQTYHNSHFTLVRKAHLSQTIWDARIVCRSSDSDYSDVMIDLEQCPGCCTGPRENTFMPESQPLWLPWVSNSRGSHELRLDGKLAKFDLCSGQEIALGDYGDSSARGFMRCGNIFEDMQKHGIDSADSVYRPVVSRVSSHKYVPRSSRVWRWDEAAVMSPVKNKQGGVEPAVKPLVLYQPKGLSLPDNEKFQLLLRALSTRLAEKDLVTTVIQCSGFSAVDDEERWMDAGRDSRLDGGVLYTDRGTLVPSYVLTRPLAWHKDLPHTKRRECFKYIREHFYNLVDLHHLIGTGVRHDSLPNWKTNGVVDFPALFGLEHLKHYVGEITFFQRLPSIIETQLRSEEPTVHPPNPLCNGLTMTRNLLRSRLRSDVGQNARDEVEAPLLLKNCEVLRGESPDEAQKTRHEMESISQSLSVGLLEHIQSSFLDASEDSHSTQTGQARSTNYGMVDVRSTVEEIVALQKRFYETKDKDEHRALEEDITGKILWLCWCGVSSEVDQRLPEVLNHVRRKLDSMPRSSARKGPSSMASQPIPDCDARRSFRAIAGIIQKTPRPDQDDRMAHLQRIMRDAGAGVSKHQLWLTARTAEQATWRRVLKDDPIVDTQEKGLSTDPEAPSTSIVHQAPDTGTMTL